VICITAIVTEGYMFLTKEGESELLKRVPMIWDHVYCQLSGNPPINSCIY